MKSLKQERFTLPSTERLKLRKQIETLFQNGKAFSVYPLRVVYSLHTRSAGDSLLLAGFSVPKKRMKLAVQRNRIKRLSREAWRLNKSALLPLLTPDKQLRLFFIFTGKEMPDYATIHKSIQKAITILTTQIQESDA